MSLTQINNGDTGLQARTKINTAFTTIDNLPVPSSTYVQTTNGATTSVATLAIGTYSAYFVEASVTAFDSSNGLAYGSKMYGTFKKVGSTTSQVSTTDSFEKSDFSTATSHIIVDTDVKIVVIGEASKTINWSINYSVTKI